MGAWTEWSTRRKGRAFAVHVPGAVTRTVRRPPAGTAIVDFALLDSVVAAFVVTPRTRALIRLDATPAAVISAVAALRMRVDARVGSAIDASRARYPVAQAHELYRMLFEPLEPLVKEARHLVIVPDGAIGVIPFDALVASAPREGLHERDAEFLIDRFTVANGTTVADPGTATGVGLRRVTVIAGEGVPAAEGEARAISVAAARGRVEVLRGTEATAASALAAARRGGIVHFATHAVANERDPAASYIALAATARDNGRLGAAEVSAATINAELVVLSACETAAGRILDGEGILSLNRGFLRAGARATIATLWPVGPSAAEFAREFYAGLAKSSDAPAALRSAKLAMRAAGAPAFAWAPYQLYSGSAPRPSSRPLALQR
jgi:CHAT domain-containing protein